MSSSDVLDRLSDESARTRAPQRRGETKDETQQSIYPDTGNCDHSDCQIPAGRHRRDVVNVFVHFVKEQDVANAVAAPVDWPGARFDAQDPRGERVAVFVSH
jgi:hypothetical protein